MEPLADHPRMRHAAMVAIFVAGMLLVTCSKTEFDDRGHRLGKVSDNETVRMVAQIWGGEDVKPGTSLYVAALGFEYASPPPFEGFCGGVLIDKNWVLTAAHCTGVKAFVIGYPDYATFSGKADQVKPGNFMCHKDYLSATQENDIALVKLSTPSTITPIPLVANEDWEMSSPPVIMAGWGENSTMLQEAEVNLFDLGKCKKKYSASPYAITAGAICTLSSKAGALEGDSGGPVMIELNHIRYLVGIMSLGSKGKGVPNKHTRITSYLDWIHDVMDGKKPLNKLIKGC